MPYGLSVTMISSHSSSGVPNAPLLWGMSIVLEKNNIMETDLEIKTKCQ